ncbi:MAG: hypothetical protein NTX00_00725 [Candidatus Parcubacteria bacterium]|nr:hypothetical protein [Candidatus Parcubacteria bacterium]
MIRIILIFGQKIITLPKKLLSIIQLVKKPMKIPWLICAPFNITMPKPESGEILAIII